MIKHLSMRVTGMITNGMVWYVATPTVMVIVHSCQEFTRKRRMMRKLKKRMGI